MVFVEDLLQFLCLVNMNCEGDADENRRLAEIRAKSVGEFLQKDGVSRSRMRTEAAPSTSKSGSAQSVRFEVGQVPF